MVVMDGKSRFLAWPFLVGLSIDVCGGRRGVLTWLARDEFLLCLMPSTEETLFGGDPFIREMLTLGFVKVVGLLSMVRFSRLALGVFLWGTSFAGEVLSVCSLSECLEDFGEGRTIYSLPIW